MSSHRSEPLSLRLFPKGLGADAYVLTGIAARCDWAVLSDLEEPRVQLRRSNPTDAPASIFLSMRCPLEALRFFHAEILPRLSAPFVLISGSEDATLPVQIDSRWSPFWADTRRIIEEIATSRHLRHWFVENLDSKFSDRVSPLPSGMVFPDNEIPVAPSLSGVPLLGPRPLKVLCGHRVRAGKQWDLRNSVNALATGPWSDFTTNLTREVTERDFARMMSEHSFVICTEGGGVDPSPKAWQALQHGAIPIIRRSALWEAYRELPCVAIDDWTEQSLSRERLELWKAELQARFDDDDARAELAHRLSSDFWWQKITSSAQPIGRDADQRQKRIVIVCPGEVVSGGPEALHQLGSALQEAGVKVAMCYFPFDRKIASAPAAYHDYGLPVCDIDEIGTSDVILPEARTGLARHFVPERTWIWWLSVDNYRGSTAKDATDRATDRHLPLRLMREMNHLAQSAYAAGFLAANGLSSQPLGDYLAGPHLQQMPDVREKERVVLYNPKKGLRVTEKLIETMPEERFVPIADLNRDEVASLLARAAVYIDFGPHPGKDRLPREAALAGCCVVTGRRGAADNRADTPIPEQYKIDEAKDGFLEKARATIKDLLDNYDARHADFDAYRQHIRAEKTRFKTQVARAFSLPRLRLVTASSGAQARAIKPEKENGMDRKNQREMSKARIEAALEAGDPDSVLAEIETAKADFADDISFLRKSLARLRGDGHAAETLPVLDTLCRTFPGKPGLGMDMGRTQLMLGHPEEAEQAFADVLSRNPSHAPAWLAQIEAALARPDEERAMRHAEAALAVLPHDPKLVEPCARLLVRLGKRVVARDALETALATPEGTSHDGLTMALAGVKRELGALDASDALYCAVLENKPDLAPAWIGRIQIALVQGNVDRALEVSAEACRQCPDKVTPQRLFAEALRRAGRDGEAGALLRSLHDRWPGDKLVALALGKACLRDGRLDEADARFRSVLERDPESWPALEGRVDVAEARGDYGAALVLLETGSHPEESDVAV